MTDPLAALLADAERPTVAEVRGWIEVSQTEIPDARLGDILDGETVLQDSYCDTDPYDKALRLALFRRCARAAAARGLPLGTLPVQLTGYGIPASEYGARLIPRLDAEIERYEGHRRVIAIA
jgi:hypothetical protein